MDQRTLFLRQVKLFVEKHGFILVPREQRHLIHGRAWYDSR